MKNLIIVSFVLLTEFNLHLHAHVTLDFMKMLTMIVKHVSLDVILVNLKLKTVPLVLVSELEFQNVFAQMVTSKTNPVLVLLVLQNV
jgi:hypothetical protein